MATGLPIEASICLGAYMVVLHSKLTHATSLHNAYEKNEGNIIAYETWHVQENVMLMGAGANI